MSLRILCVIFIKNVLVSKKKSYFVFSNVPQMSPKMSLKMSLKVSIKKLLNENGFENRQELR